MAENPEVHFVELPQEEYDNAIGHSDSTLYYCPDSQKVYKGDVMYGAGDFVVTYTSESTSQGSKYVADKTYSEITAAIAAHKNVKAYYSDNLYTFSHCWSEGVEFFAAWGGRIGGSAKVSVLTHQPNGTISIDYYNLGS